MVLRMICPLCGQEKVLTFAGWRCLECDYISVIKSVN